MNKKALCSGISRNRGLFLHTRQGKIIPGVKFSTLSTEFSTGFGERLGKPGAFLPRTRETLRFMGFPGTASLFSEQMLGEKSLCCPGLPVQNSPGQQKTGAETRSGWSEI